LEGQFGNKMGRSFICINEKEVAGHVGANFGGMKLDN
jgi:hypothetical protein